MFMIDLPESSERGAGMTSALSNGQAVEYQSSKGDGSANEGDNRDDHPGNQLVYPLFPFPPQLLGLRLLPAVKVFGLGFELPVNPFGQGLQVSVKLLGLGVKPRVEHFALGIKVSVKLLGLSVKPRVEHFALGIEGYVKLLGLGFKVFVKLLRLGGNLLLRGFMLGFKPNNIGLARQVGVFRRPRAFQAGDALSQVAHLLDNASLGKLLQCFDALFQDGVVFRHVNLPKASDSID
ncbi:MAG: hypothetical protein OXT68_06280 [Chloroflexota bacterium]|nr:hypothetical protein [Chloroflexota bacterium]